MKRRYREQLARDMERIMRVSTFNNIPCSFYNEVATHFRYNLTLFAGPGCSARACCHRAEYGLGGVLVLEPGADPECMLWPVWDRVIKIDWPNADWVRLKQLERALVRDGADVVAGCDRAGELVLFPVQKSQREPKLKKVSATLVCHFEALGPRRAA
jgi:hypothetical protein